ncbi:MAG: hypothetical protein IJT32_05640 [Lachnospiraceae bacterium]|nr:hypothetical protein [Lachnospiraceae bacterium]
MEFKKYEDLTLADNFMFCKVFTRYEALCKKLVEVILGRKVDHIVDWNREWVMGRGKYF